MTKREASIEIFRTNIQNRAQSRQIKSKILKRYPGTIISFDLEDSDRVLRIEGLFQVSGIIGILIEHGYTCEVLE